jgi:poly-gamma-glutamate synthesis protein (capsule biosynthesis protein)
MAATLMLTGDVNLLNVSDASQPFRSIKGVLATADLVFANLECMVAKMPEDFSWYQEGFYADPQVAGAALKDAGIGVVGNANNVNYGPYGILASNRNLDGLGIAHCGSGPTIDVARAPVIVEREGIRFGFMQRSSVFWGTGHEARPDAAGIAVVRGHTGYTVPMHPPRGALPLNRPGIPPKITTWADPDDLIQLRKDIGEARKKADVLVASFHWGYGPEVLQYQKDIAHAAIDAGADMVVGHGTHSMQAIEIYKGKVIFYGVACFYFNTHHGGEPYTGWTGLLPSTQWEGSTLRGASVRLLRPGPNEETTPRPLSEEAEKVAAFKKQCAIFGTDIEVVGDELKIRIS